MHCRSIVGCGTAGSSDRKRTVILLQDIHGFIAVPIRRGTDSPVLKPWNIARPFRLGEKQVGTHQIGCVPWLLSRLTGPVALNFPIFAGLFFVVCHSAVQSSCCNLHSVPELEPVAPA